MSSKPPFDALAPTYDVDFTASPIARHLRARVHERLARHFHPGDTILELGCGTGEDALWLARRGVRVVATDSSQVMLDAARAKTAAEPLVTVARLDLRTLADKTGMTRVSSLRNDASDERARYIVPLHDDTFHEPPLENLVIPHQFDGVFSNFGPLNCLDEWDSLATWLAARVKPGGMVALGVMGPLCLWEIGWHGLHGDVKTATRRLRGATFQPDAASAPLPIHYPSPRRLTRAFTPWFQRVYLRPLGLALPPSDVYGVVEKRPRLLDTLKALDTRLSRFAFLAPFADHYWIEMRREADEAK